jgi:hypothetical protein
MRSHFAPKRQRRLRPQFAFGAFFGSHFDQLVTSGNRGSVQYRYDYEGQYRLVDYSKEEKARAFFSLGNFEENVSETYFEFWRSTNASKYRVWCKLILDI